jgi:nucleoside-diphosphate-sugar epimerase
MRESPLSARVRHVLITGGAGYIGTLLTAKLLSQGVSVTVIDRLLHGGDAVLGFLPMKGYRFIHGDIRDAALLKEAVKGADTVIHLAALVGFPVCDKVGREETFSVNVEGSRQTYEQASVAGAKRFLFASSYSNYGIADGKVSEESPLNPQSTYAESKVAAEEYLVAQPTGQGPVTICVRLSTLFGVSPRTRFDLMVNQFALSAHQGERLVLYQRDFNRAFVHVQDVADAMFGLLAADPDKVDRQIFNVGGDELNSSKSQLVALLKEQWTNLVVEHRDLEFSGDMRSIHVCFAKIRATIGFVPRWSLRDGIAEIHQALTQGLISSPSSERYRNHPVLVS